MVNLKAIYGEQIFDRKASYRNGAFIPFVASILIDVIIAWGIVQVFHVSWDYAFIKVYAILFLFGILKYILSYLIDLLNYKLVMKDAFQSEIRHYLRLFGGKVDWNGIATYDDFFLSAAFSKTLSPDLRVLAALNYGTIVGLVASSGRYEDRLYWLFDPIAREFLESRKADSIQEV